MKKLLLSLGALSAVVAPVAAVVACGSTDSDANKTHTSTLGVTSTKTAAELKTASVGTDATAVSLGAEFGIPSTQIQGMDGTTYVFDAKALTLTATSVTAGVTMIQIITITPASAPVVEGIKGGDVVEHAFQGKATFANVNGQDSDTTFSSDNKALFDALGNGQTLETELKAIADFNAANVKFEDGFTAADDANKAVVSALEGKTLKAELFYQQDNDGSATFIESASDGADSASTFQLDKTESGHRINGVGSYGVLIVEA